MLPWVSVAFAGMALSMVGLAHLLRRYRRGAVTGRFVLAVVVGLVAFASYALFSALWPGITDGIVTVLMLTPAFVAIVVLIREHEKTGADKPES